jgi:hypothetical protein
MSKRSSRDGTVADSDEALEMLGHRDAGQKNALNFRPPSCAHIVGTGAAQHVVGRCRPSLGLHPAAVRLYGLTRLAER